MNNLRTAAQQALEALKMMRDEYGEANCPACDHADAAVYALKAALAESDRDWSLLEATQESLRDHMAEIHRLRASLAEPVQEPVAWASKRTLDRIKDFDSTIYANGGFDDAVPLYIAPPQRKPMTEDEIELAYRHIYRNLPYEFDHSTPSWVEQGIRYAERAHGIGGSDA